MTSCSVQCENSTQKSKKGDEVVISGISGIFPKSDNVYEFMDNLYNKIDMVEKVESTWSSNHPELPKYCGKIRNSNKFDAQFFKVSYKLACFLEPQSRKLLEHTYAAIFDSGTNHLDLKNKRIGVFMGAVYLDISNYYMFNAKKTSRFILYAGSKSMFANRISYWIDGKGPSYCLDYAEASSAAALDLAYRSMNSGVCDVAIVGGSNFCVHPNLFINIKKAGLLCMDGKTKCFDKDADGYVRSEAVSVVFLQRAKDAKRIYAELCHVKGEYGLGSDAKFLPTRKSEDIKKFLKEFYSEIDIEPVNVEYVEAEGTAIQEADINEMTAISDVFANNNRCVNIGCVKSNMGCAEAASALCALTKLCLSYHTGRIPPNLYYSEPHNINAVKEDKVKVLTNNTSFNRTYTALNNFSMTGANYHVLLKGMYKQKDLKKYLSPIPYIVLASGRQEKAIYRIFKELRANHIDPEQIGLLHNIYKMDIPGHIGRGYSIYDTNEMNETVRLARKLEYYSGTKRPLWFIYGGMGSQWLTMGADLMKIRTFADAIYKCHEVLHSKGIDLIHVLTSKDDTIFENILNAFIGITAVQIGLTDVLREIGIEPDYIIGHSLGEIACGYHDKSLTREEAMLFSYYRGIVSINANLPLGSMAAVGLGFKNIVHKLPPEIEVACHNSSTSVTVSGPAEEMNQFISQLIEEGVFAQRVQPVNIAYHSRYVEKCGPELLKRLETVITDPKPRSRRWLSTSVPQHQWDEPFAKYSSPEYYTNNLLKPVLFEETAKLIPDNAVIVEIAPHGLLQAILKRSHNSCTHITLARREVESSVQYLLEAIGELYLNGFNPKVDVLYPKIEYPVSTETPLLSHLVEWEHSENWPTEMHENGEEIRARSRNVVLSLFDDDFSYLKGNVIAGDNMLPEAAIIVLVWETLSMYKEINYRGKYVLLEDINFHAQVHLVNEKPLRLNISVSRGNGEFEVLHDARLVASGIVSGVRFEKLQNDFEEHTEQTLVDEIVLSENDVYRILELRGYNYRHQFKSIHSSNLSYTKACIKWANNWVTFLDSLIQLNRLAKNHVGISTPKFIKKVKIDVLKQKNDKPLVIDGCNYYNAEFNEVCGILRCAGIEIDSILFEDNILENTTPDVIETKQFYPHYLLGSVEIKNILKIFFQIITENTTTQELKVLPFLSGQSSDIYDSIKEFTDNNLLINADVKILIEKEKLCDIKEIDNENIENVVIYENLFSEEKKICELHRITRKCDFFIAIEQSVSKLNSKIKDYFTIISSMSDGNKILVLMKKINLISNQIYMRIPLDTSFTWVTRLYDELKTTKHVILVSENQPYCGLEKLVKKLRNGGLPRLSLLVIDDIHAPKFYPENDIYKEQLQKDLAVNVFKKGQWGGYYYTKSDKTLQLKSVTLTSVLPGDFNGLTWIEAPSLAADNNYVQVYFAEISEGDSLRAIGGINNDHNSFGMSFSGIDKREHVLINVALELLLYAGPMTCEKPLGLNVDSIKSSGERVMGVIAGGAVSSTVICDPDLLWPVPEHWSLEDAATVPLPYLQAYYCLAHRSNVQLGNSVFITDGAGTLSQAVISLCLSLDCTVYTAVSSLDKKEFLMKVFPQLNEKNIGYTFEEYALCMIANNKEIGNCDYVINCSSGTLRQDATKYVSYGGTYMDLNKYDMFNNQDLYLNYFDNNKHYKAIDVSSVFNPKNILEKKKLQSVITEGIQKGIVKPLCRVVYTLSDVTKAFRLKAINRNKGSVLLRMKDSNTMTTGFEVIPRLTYSSSGVYMIVCDEEGIGIELADKLVKHGANMIVLNINQTLVTGYLHTKFQSWMKRDVRIKLSNENLNSEKACTNLLREVSKMGPLLGVFIVQDVVHKHQVVTETAEIFSAECNKFAMVVKNLDVFTRNCNVRQFVIITHKCQNDSQEYSSSLAENICKARNELGLPALVVHHDIDELIVTSKLIKRPQYKVLSELFSSMEIGLRSKYTNIRSFNLKKDYCYSNFTEDILRILGVKKLDELNENVNLNALKVTETAVEELRCLIKRIYKVDYTTEKIREMTIDRITKTGDSLIKKNHNFNGGLEAFYSTVDAEYHYVLESQPVVPMLTLLDNGLKNTIDPNDTYLIMVPGFEGRCQIFDAIAERLKVKAVSIPLGPDLGDVNGVEDIAQYLKSMFASSSHFYLLGYSFGVNIVLELASILESEGLVGTVYCLDSGPDVLKHQFNAYVGELEESELENVIVEHLYYLMSGKRSKTFHEDIHRLKSFDEKTEAFVNELKGEVSYSQEYKRCVLKAAHGRIKAAFKHKPDLVLNSEIVLIKGIPHPNAVEMSEDCGLSKYTKKSVKVFDIDSDHAMAPYDCKVSNIVNKLLQPELLEEYKNTNLCDVYLTEV